MLDYEMLMQLAIEAYTNLNIFHKAYYDVAYITLDGKGVGNLPADYVDYIKVAINLCGRYYTLTLNNNIIPPQGDLCGLPITQIAAGCCERGEVPYPMNGYGFLPHYRGDIFIPTFFAMGGGWSMAGQFRIDAQNRQIIVSGQPKHEIVIEYKSSGVKKGQTTYVPIQAREAIIAWMRWQLSEYGHINANPERMMRNYLAEENLLKNLDHTLTYESYLDTFYQGWQQGPKR